MAESMGEEPDEEELRRNKAAGFRMGKAGGKVMVKIPKIFLAQKLIPTFLALISSPVKSDSFQSSFQI